MDDRGYIFVDGSRLFSSIAELWRTRKKYNKKPLHVGRFCQALQRVWSLNVGSLTRIVIYVKPNDRRLKEMVIVPKTESPGEKDHWRIIECGVSINAVPDAELQKLSARYRDHFARAEKGLDIKLACDALLLVSSGRISNVVFLVNDRDYLPLFESIHSLGGNTYLAGLDSRQKVQKDLARVADKFLTLDNDLENIFGPVQTPSAPEVLQQAPVPSVADAGKN